MFGVEDATCRAVGIDDENLFKTMDAIQTQHTGILYALKMVVHLLFLQRP